MIAKAVSPVRIFDTAEDLARHVADWFVERVRERPQRFAVCLSGGSTPKRLYELLATPPYRARVSWEQTHWFWGDERVVAHDDARNNAHMAREALLDRVPVPPENIHAIATERMSAEASAAAYEAALKRFYGADVLDRDRPLFDLTLLGLGDDGHTASLFPGSPVLVENRRWAVPAIAAASPKERITLTYPALESSRITAFLVAGAGKRDVLARVRRGDTALPAARLHQAGAVCWFADRAAAPDRDAISIAAPDGLDPFRF